MKLTIELDENVINAIRAYYNEEIEYIGLDNGVKLLKSVYAAIKKEDHK